jgi:nitroimidazol reductase NimA-like FMN-containing flavoprotein (pyridoxamine 5'-phosphate oxidase superfamily)
MTNPQKSPREKPVASRPYQPDESYGIPKSRKGLLPWSHVQERMAQAKVYWVSTVSADGRPHATPVDGIWMDGRLYFGGGEQTRRNRNLSANPAVCVHLESGSDVVILHGEAHELNPAPRALAERLAQENLEKYGYPSKPEDYNEFAQSSVRQYSPPPPWRCIRRCSTRLRRR